MLYGSVLVLKKTAETPQPLLAVSEDTNNNHIIKIIEELIYITN